MNRKAELCCEQKGGAVLCEVMCEQGGGVML